MASGVIPLQATANQTLNVIINNRFLRLDVYQRSTGVFLNVWLSDSLVVSGAVCQNQKNIIHADYLGLGVELFFFDMQGSSDPDYTGLGSRYILLYTVT